MSDGDPDRNEIVKDTREIVAEDEVDSPKDRENMSPGEILDEVRRVATEGEETDAQAAQGGAPPPNLIERGVVGWLPGLAMAVLGFLFSVSLQGQFIEALAIPALVDIDGEDGLFVSWFLWVMILTDARLERAGQLIAFAAVTVLYFVVAVMAWAGAAALLFHLAPEHEFGIVTALLLGVPAAIAGLATYRLIDRLAGRGSPWHVDRGVFSGSDR